MTDHWTNFLPSGRKVTIHKPRLRWLPEMNLWRCTCLLVWGEWGNQTIVEYGFTARQARQNALATLDSTGALVTNLLMEDSIHMPPWLKGWTGRVGELPVGTWVGCAPLDRSRASTNGDWWAKPPMGTWVGYAPRDHSQVSTNGGW